MDSDADIDDKQKQGGLARDMLFESSYVKLLLSEPWSICHFSTKHQSISLFYTTSTTL